jgi:hypothetical protein
MATCAQRRWTPLGTWMPLQLAARWSHKRPSLQGRHARASSSPWAQSLINSLPTLTYGGGIGSASTSLAWSTSSSTPKTATARANCSPASSRQGSGRRRATTTPLRARSWALTRSSRQSSRTSRCRSIPRVRACGRPSTARGTRFWLSASRCATGRSSRGRTGNELLPRGLQLVEEEEPPAGIILYAMTVYDETHPDAFKTGQFGGGTGGENDGDGDDKKQKGKPPPKPSRDTSHTAKTGTTTPSKPSGSKRKAPKGRAEDTSGPRGSQRPKPATPVLKNKRSWTRRPARSSLAWTPRGRLRVENVTRRYRLPSRVQGRTSCASSNSSANSKQPFPRASPRRGFRSWTFSNCRALLQNGSTQRQPNSSRRPTTSSSNCVVQSFSPRPFG